jgi:glucan phosphoethanolaminetransferase (alkaline phosphatase superfamily)
MVRVTLPDVSSRLKNADVFAALNVVLFGVMCAVVYYDRFVHYRGPGNLHEFFLYAAAIVALIVAAWYRLRRYALRTSALVLVQTGIAAHFAGAFVPVGGGRLYDAILFGIRYDKGVHFFNAFVASWLLAHVFEVLGVQLLWLRALVVLLTVLGLGAVVEIVEYVVVLTVQGNGVGGYDNNMQDMIGNLAGGLTFAIVASARARHPGRVPHAMAEASPVRAPPREATAP